MGLLSDFFSSVFSKVLSLSIPQIDILLLLIKIVLDKMQVKDTDEDKLEVGDRVLQAEEKGIYPENYESFDEYYEAIKNFEIDPEKSLEFTDKEKLDKFAAVKLAQIEEKLGRTFTDFLTTVAMNLSPDFKIESKIDKYCDYFTNDLEDISKYFKGELSDKEFDIINSKLVEIEKLVDPTKNETDIYNCLSEERAKVQNYGV